MGWNRDFKYSELYNATQGFSQKNFLSEGGFGAVYKGKLDGMTIAVKQHKSASSQGEKEFKSEVNVLSNARHENVVMLLGSCSEGSNRLLVYEYVCNGSLDQHLSREQLALIYYFVTFFFFFNFLVVAYYKRLTSAILLQNTLDHLSVGKIGLK